MMNLIGIPSNRQREKRKSRIYLAHGIQISVMLLVVIAGRDRAGNIRKIERRKIMSLGEEWLNEHAFELYGPNKFASMQEELDDLSDTELLNRCIKEGKTLDNFEHFPAYSVAQKILSHGWRLTEKQRAAMINCLAYHLTKEEEQRDVQYGYEDWEVDPEMGAHS